MVADYLDDPLFVSLVYAVWDGDPAASAALRDYLLERGDDLTEKLFADSATQWHNGIPAFVCWPQLFAAGPADPSTGGCFTVRPKRKP